jgi:hypothetical protein
MADLAAIAGQAAIGAFQQTFDPHGSKRQAVEHEDSAEKRRAERHEQELSLKEQQIKQAKIKTTLAEDSKQFGQLMNKFNARNQDPAVAAEMYNMNAQHGNELDFDREHFESTASGGNRQAAPVDSTQAGQTEDRLKPDAERQGALVGAQGGEIRFRTGYYERDAKGQKIPGPDGKPKFVETGEPVLYRNHAEMMEDVAKIGDPKYRTAVALSELSIDEFFKKEEGRRDTDKKQHGYKMEEIEASAKGQLEVAKEQSRGKMGAAGIRKAPTDTQKRAIRKDNIKKTREHITKMIRDEGLVDEDARKEDILSTQDAEAIYDFSTSKAGQEAFKRLEAVASKDHSGVKINNIVNKLMKEYNLPKHFRTLMQKRARTVMPEQKDFTVRPDAPKEKEKPSMAN